MKEFKLRVGDRTYAIGMNQDLMTVDGFSLAWQVVEAEGSHFRVAIDGICYDVELREPENGRWAAVVDGVEYTAEPSGLVRGRPAPKKAERREAAPVSVEGALTAMMPSKVLAVRVEVGDRVEADQVIMVLEAMKMESELKSPYAGTVAALHCAAGDSVDPGIPLVVIEPDGGTADSR